MAHSDAIPIVESLLDELTGELVNSDETICAEMAITNADSWGLDEYDDLRAWFEGHGKIRFSVELTLSGDQDEDKFSCGDTIKTKIEGQLLHKNGKWEVADYNVLKAMLGDSYTDWHIFYTDD